MFGQHHVRENEIVGTSSSDNTLCFFPIYAEEGKEFVIALVEEYKTQVHKEMLREKLVVASVRVSKDKLIERLLDIIPFVEIRDFVERKERTTLAKQAEKLLELGVPDDTVNKICMTILGKTEENQPVPNEDNENKNETD